MSRRKKANAAPDRAKERSDASAGRTARSPRDGAGSGLAHHPADPPRPRRGRLIAAAVLLALWMAALLAMAVRYGAFRVGI